MAMNWGVFGRSLFTITMIAPLGLVLGSFMPLGLSTVSRLGVHPESYTAWSWAVNGFASVGGSVLTTILAMAFGFKIVLALALVVYITAAIALSRLPDTRTAGI
jgi:hypothetical protein